MGQGRGREVVVEEQSSVILETTVKYVFTETFGLQIRCLKKKNTILHFE